MERKMIIVETPTGFDLLTESGRFIGSFEDEQAARNYAEWRAKRYPQDGVAPK